MAAYRHRCRLQKDFDTLDAAGNRGSIGIWSDGTTMWVGDWHDGKIYVYRMAGM